MGIIDGIRNSLPGRGIDLGNDNASTLRREALGDGLAEAAARAGYDGDFVVEFAWEGDQWWF